MELDERTFWELILGSCRSMREQVADFFHHGDFRNRNLDHGIDHVPWVARGRHSFEQQMLVAMRRSLFGALGSRYLGSLNPKPI